MRAGPLVTVHRCWSTVMMLAFATQITLAARGAFGAGSYDAHEMLGSFLIIGGFVALLLTLVLKRYRIVTAIGVLLLIVQAVLGGMGMNHPWMGELHGLNAVLVIGVWGSTTGRAWRGSGGSIEHDDGEQSTIRPVGMQAPRRPAG
jgi:hypothetical protein